MFLYRLSWRRHPVQREHGDRYIPARDILNDEGITKKLDAMTLEAVSVDPAHTARLADAVGIQLDKRVLGFHEAPPPSASSKLMAEHREYARSLYTRPGELASNTGAVTNKSRKIPTVPERVLDAPGMADDFYLNLLSWSALNIVAVALTENTYVWKADTGDVVHVGEAPEGSYVSSVDFSADGTFLGIGMGTGDVELWDIESNSKLRTMSGHLGQVAALSWNGHILSSACGDGTIWHHDVRIARHKVAELVGHTGEVCGLKWRPDGELLASGGNDNVVNIWDARMGTESIAGESAEASRGGAKWTKRSHTAAVKVLSTLRGRSKGQTALTTLPTGLGLVSVAAVFASIRRWHQRCNYQCLEQYDWGALAHVKIAVTSHHTPLVPPQKGDSLHSRLPDQFCHDPLLSFPRTRRRDSRRS